VASSVDPGISEATLMVIGAAVAELLADDAADSLEDGAALELADEDAAALEAALEVSAALLEAALVAADDAADVAAVVPLAPEPLFELQAVATRTVRAPTAAMMAVLRRDMVGDSFFRSCRECGAGLAVCSDR
jgi:site-specific recombinase